MTANSQNGGLLNSTNTTTDTAFASLVPYTIGLVFGEEDVASPVRQGDFGGWDGAQATAGTFRITVRVREDENRLLLAGTYNDFLQVRMTPTI